MKNNLYGRDLVTVEKLTKDDVESVFEKADEISEMVKQKGADTRLKGKIMAALFFEPSSRTFSSFITSMQRLGGGIIPLNGMTNTSISKGETLADTARVFSSYADVLVIRHPEPGAVALAAENSDIPVISAGDGVNEHPSQALIDLYTIRKKFGKSVNLNILMIGDLAHYRPTNSLAKLLALYPEIKMSFATPADVPLPESVKSYLRKKKVEFKEYTDFSGLLSSIDILYVTRVKKEYMSEELYQKIQGSYVIDASVLAKMKKDSIIMHCLPRVGEINPDIDRDPRSVYLTKQVRNGMYVRMAILDLILNKNE